MILKINNQEIEIKTAFHFFQSFKGFMFQKDFHYGLIFHCSSIHTFFMKEKIDVIQTDKNFSIQRIYYSLPKNKIILPKRNIYYTIELPEHTIKNLKEKDKLNIK